MTPQMHHAAAAAILAVLATQAAPTQPQPVADRTAESNAASPEAGMTTGELIIEGVGLIVDEDANAALPFLLDAIERDDAPALAHYALGVAYHGIGALGSARAAYLRAAAMPTSTDDKPVVFPVDPTGARVDPERIAASATYNATLIDLDAADAQALAIADIDPEPAALSLDPASAFAPFEQAARAALDAYLNTAQNFRDAHNLDALVESETPPDDALRNFELARLRALEVRRDLEEKRRLFNELLEQIISPREAFEQIAELYQDQRDLQSQSEGESFAPEPDLDDIEQGQKSVLQRLQRLADRLDNTASLAERQQERAEQGASAASSEDAMQEQMLAQFLAEFLRRAQEGVDEAGQRAFAGLRQLEAGNPDIAAEEQAAAAEALLEIMRQLGDQSEAAQNAAEQLAERMQDQAQQAGEPPQPEPGEEQPQPGQQGEDQEGDPQQAQAAEEAGDGEDTEDLLEAVLEKEREDRERVNRRKRKPVPRDW